MQEESRESDELDHRGRERVEIRKRINGNKANGSLGQGLVRDDSMAAYFFVKL